jgi:hypothetical protein
MDAAARRLGLEDIPVEPRGQWQRRHGRRVIQGAALVDQPAIGGQPHRLARGAEADLHLGTVGNPVDVRTELVGEEPAAAVTAVEPDRLPEQAAGHADARPGALVPACTVARVCHAQSLPQTAPGSREHDAWHARAMRKQRVDPGCIRAGIAGLRARGHWVRRGHRVRHGPRYPAPARSPVRAYGSLDRTPGQC